MSKPGPRCSECPLKDSPGIVWGTGPSSAKLAIIGQNPEQTEIDTGLPFSGVSGASLSLRLGQAGISREQSFVTNAVKCFVKAGVAVPSKALECCYPLLEKELSLLPQAKTYLTLGAPAFSIFSGKKLLTTTDGKGGYKKDPKVWLRGCPYILSYSAKKAIIPTFHPAYLGYTGNRDRFIFEMDLKKAKRFADGEGDFTQPVFNYKPTNQEVREYVEECIAKSNVGLDIETPEKAATDEEELVGSGAGNINVVGISSRIGEAIGVQPDQFDLLEPLYTLPSVNLFIFNALFDRYHIEAKRGVKLSCQVIDVMLGLHELHSDFQAKNLAIACSLYTDLPFHKNLAKSKPDYYNALDTYGVLWAGLNMLEKMKELNCLDHFLKLTNACLPIVEELRTKGPRADVAKAENFEMMCYKALKQYNTYWDKILPNTSWSSPKQLLPLFTAQGLPVQYQMRKDRKTGKRTKTATLNEKALEKYRDTHKSQIAGLVLLMRKLKKARDFTQLHQSDGFIHATYGMHFQKQGRIQTRNPDLQNTPEGLVSLGRDSKGEEQYAVRPREIVIPDDENHVIITADFAQIELRLFAKQANERKLLDEIEKGTYIYGITYEAIYKRPFFANVPPGEAKSKKYRAPYVTAKELLVAKTGPLGWIYGREDYTETGMSKEESKMFGALMHQTYPAISEFQKKLDREVRRANYLRNPFNRIRWVANPVLMRNEYLSFLGQGTAVDVLILNALLPLHAGLAQFGEHCRLIFTVYDSIGVNCPKDTARDCVEFIRENMENYLKETNGGILDGFTIPVDIKVGRSWGEADSG